MYCGADWEGETYDHLRIVPEEPFKKEFIEKWRKEEIIISDTENEGDIKHMDNFFDCVHSRKQPNCNPDIGCKVMVTIGLSVRSYREGKMFFFDSERERVATRGLRVSRERVWQRAG
jgi:hypothetical protein